MTVTHVRLFVYGSLKRGAMHHAELGGAPFVGEAETEPGYALSRQGQYWALSAEGTGSGVVRGELFEVSENQLAALDDFEGPAYVRGAVALSAVHSCGFGEALAYFAKSR